MVAEGFSLTDTEASQLESIKHPLEHTWNFWLFTNKNKNNWADNMVQLSSFDTVEDYWSHYHHMKEPSELERGQDYAVFKQGIRPMWEDEENKHGGRWLIIPPGHVQGQLDRLWLDVVLLMIGENFVHSDLVSGAVVNIREGSRSKINVWTQKRDHRAVLEIGKKLKQALTARFRCIYCLHDSNKVLYSV